MEVIKRRPVSQPWPHEERLASVMSRVNKQEDGCWLWTSSTEREGYGYIHLSRANAGEKFRHQVVHKFIYEAFRGVVPDGLELDHLCRNRLCVNPDHLEPVTHKENILRGNSPSALAARKTHCHRGHEFTPENTYVYKTGRVCKLCHSKYMKVWNAENRRKSGIR